jgi:adenosylhomocysteine nucleosidase
MKNIVLLISADSEWRAIKEILAGRNLKIAPTPLGETFNLQLEAFDLIFMHGGWGKISAAATAQYAIDHFQPELLVNLGTCGGLDGCARPGDILLVERTLVYDIVEQMGDAQEALEHYSAELDLSWLAGLSFPADVRRGLLVSADRDILVEDVAMLIERFNASAADWESGAIAWVAARNGVPCLILRGVTDIVSADGGEAYGNIDLFHQRTRTLMARLLEILPMFLKSYSAR